jgi:hypothetical protein
VKIIATSTSGKKTASCVIRDSNAYLGGVFINKGSGVVTLTLYDNASEAAGEELWYFSLAGVENSYPFSFPIPVYCRNGIYAELSGTATFIIYSCDCEADSRIPKGP